MKKFISILLLAVISFNGFLGYQIYDLKNQAEAFGKTVPVVVALFETSLQASVTSTATSITMVKGTDKRGTTLSGTIGYVIDEGTASEEFIICSTSGTALTSCLRGIDVQDGETEVTALQFTHRRGASIKITNFPQLALLSRISNGQESFPNQLYYSSAFSQSAASTSAIVHKSYVDGLVIAGAPDASLTVKGISELATVAQINAGTGMGDDTTARLFINPSYLASSNYSTFLPTTKQKDALAGSLGTPSTTNRYITMQEVSSSSFSTTASRSDWIIRSDGDSLPTLYIDLTKLTTTGSASGDFIVKANAGGAFGRLASPAADDYYLVSSASQPFGYKWMPTIRQAFMKSVGNSVATFTIPSDTKMAIVRMYAHNNESPDAVYGGEVTIFPTGKTTGEICTEASTILGCVIATYTNSTTITITTVASTNICDANGGRVCTVYTFK
mgnify:FL=1